MSGWMDGGESTHKRPNERTKKQERKNEEATELMNTRREEEEEEESTRTNGQKKERNDWKQKDRQGHRTMDKRFYVENNNWQTHSIKQQERKTKQKDNSKKSTLTGRDMS